MLVVDTHNDDTDINELLDKPFDQLTPAAKEYEEEGWSYLVMPSVDSDTLLHLSESEVKSFSTSQITTLAKQVACIADEQHS